MKMKSTICPRPCDTSADLATPTLPPALKIKLKQKKRSGSTLKLIKSSKAGIISNTILFLLRNALSTQKTQIRRISTSVITINKDCEKKSIVSNVHISPDELKCITDRLNAMKKTNYVFSTEVSDNKGRLIAIVNNTISFKSCIDN